MEFLSIVDIDQYKKDFKKCFGKDGAYGIRPHLLLKDEPLLDGVLSYVIHGRLQGGFLNAVFSNDLNMAVLRADLHSLDILHNLVRFLRDQIPANSIGGEQNFERWRRLGGLIGINELTKQGKTAKEIWAS